MQALLFEVEANYDSVITPELRDELIEHSVSELKFRSIGDNALALDYGYRPIVSADVLAKLPGWRVVRAISNGSTRSLVEFGTRTTTVVNERCSVAVAGLGLLTITEVEAHEDLCTHELQKRLDDGWRIVAVCVQPDQRRPDYILGRSP